VELSKAGFSWPPAKMVERNIQAFEREVLASKTPCRPGPLERVTSDMAEVHAELLLIHPFREGNGRLARWLAELMALQAGLPLPVYRFLGPQGGKVSGGSPGRLLARLPAFSRFLRGLDRAGILLTRFRGDSRPFESKRLAGIGRKALPQLYALEDKTVTLSQRRHVCNITDIPYPPKKNRSLSRYRMVQ